MKQPGRRGSRVAFAPYFNSNDFPEYSAIYPVQKFALK